MDVPPFKPNTIGVYARCHSMLISDMVTSPPGVSVDYGGTKRYKINKKSRRKLK
jgi:hypothetical protein